MSAAGLQLFGVVSLVVCLGGFGFWMTRGRMVVAVACFVIGAVGFGYALTGSHAEQAAAKRAEICGEEAP